MSENRADLNGYWKKKLDPEDLAWDHAMEISGSIYKRMQSSASKARTSRSHGCYPSAFRASERRAKHDPLKTLARLESALDMNMAEGFRHPKVDETREPDTCKIIQYAAIAPTAKSNWIDAEALKEDVMMQPSLYTLENLSIENVDEFSPTGLMSMFVDYEPMIEKNENGVSYRVGLHLEIKDRPDEPSVLQNRMRGLVRFRVRRIQRRKRQMGSNGRAENPLRTDERLYRNNNRTVREWLVCSTGFRHVRKE